MVRLGTHRRTVRFRGVMSGLAALTAILGSAVFVVANPSKAGAAVPPIQWLTPANAPPLTVGQPYALTIQATGGVGPYTYWIKSGNELSPGLTFTSNGTTATISGTPQEVVPYPLYESFYVAVQDSETPNPQWSQQAFYLTINTPGYVAPTPLQNTTTSIPDATVSQPYSFQMQASGGTPPYNWQASGLPKGFTMSQSGLITGSSSALPEQYPVYVHLWDSGPTYNGVYGYGSEFQTVLHTNYTFTVSSGNPELDPYLFKLSALLAGLPADESYLDYKLQSLIDPLIADVQGLINDVEYEIGAIVCDVVGSTPVGPAFGCGIP